jgi:uncharacterized protein (DUF433 family)
MIKEVAPRIVVNPEVRFGKPVIKGTRVDVETVISALGAGMPVDEVMREYDLEREDILAALQYAAHILSLEEVRSLE